MFYPHSLGVYPLPWVFIPLSSVFIPIPCVFIPFPGCLSPFPGYLSPFPGVYPHSLDVLSHSLGVYPPPSPGSPSWQREGALGFRMSPGSSRAGNLGLQGSAPHWDQGSLAADELPQMDEWGETELQRVPPWVEMPLMSSGRVFLAVSGCSRPELTFCASALLPSSSLPKTQRCPVTDPPKRPWGPSWGWQGLVRAIQFWI